MANSDKGLFGATAPEDYTFLSFKKVTKTNLDDYHIFVKNEKGNRYICFNTGISSQVKAKQLDYVRFRLDNVTEDLHIMFQSEKTPDALRVNNKNSNHCYLNCKEAVEYLCKVYGIEGEGNLRISKNLSKKEGYLTIQVFGKE